MSDNIDQATFAKRLWSAKTIADVDWILAGAETMYGPVTTKPIGDRPNNSGIIRVSSDPMLALVERITNAIDACMELRFALAIAADATPWRCR